MYEFEYICEVDIATDVDAVFITLNRCGGARTVINPAGMLFLFGSEMAAKPRIRLVWARASQHGWRSRCPKWK